MNKKLGQAINMAINTETNFKDLNAQIGSKPKSRTNKQLPKFQEECKSKVSGFVSVPPLNEDVLPVSSPFSNYTKNAYLTSPQYDENTETNVEADLHYDSDR